MPGSLVVLPYGKQALALADDTVSQGTHRRTFRMCTFRACHQHVLGTHRARLLCTWMFTVNTLKTNVVHTRGRGGDRHSMELVVRNGTCA